MNYYQHHIGDYRRDTSHLSLLEHGIYRQLIDLYYMEEKPIPKETQWVMRRLSAKTQEEQDAVKNVLNDFFELSEDGYSHRRCDSEIDQYHQKAEKNRENGKKGGRPAKNKPVDNQSDTEAQNPEKPSGFISESESKANETLTNNHKPLTNIYSAPESEADIPDGPAKRKSKPTVTLKTFMENCKANGEPVIADYQPLLTYAGSVNLPEEMLVLCWEEFKVRYLPDGPSAAKRYKDWRIVFLTAVKENWLKIWWVEPDGTYSLTTRGKQAEMAHREAA
ncbi:YdaU family protein [Advenella mimigardefordensis]|uniref:DUF1376 domain-containing protein n=1 Tax=Advenella mimigardefordensis (strain DSM 17166 / LMG 22922 / DPN7) TaxID=1247726 RepID=W0PCE9_ADVMD|nr:DUF1376 domain-containing protein [Advenella mimigardefordensis]AHG63167.1 hypothetical protein MIM_c10690 [Advenella mimigardefordensis DPN7]